MLRDPDIVLGFEVTDRSIGYLMQRAEALRWVWRPPAAPFAAADESEFNKHAQWTFPAWISRMPGAPVHPRNGVDTYMRDSAQTGGGWWLHGRVILNGWRVAKAELTMGSYTLEAVAAKTLHVRLPHYSIRAQRQMWRDRSAVQRARLLAHVLTRAEVSLRIIRKLDIVNVAGEFARLLGIDLVSALSRGSQYRVEAVLLRLAHREGYLAPSPSNAQVASQPGLEEIALVMEPRSQLYHDPVVVLDFQSLCVFLLSLSLSLFFLSFSAALSPGGRRRTRAA